MTKMADPFDELAAMFLTDANAPDNRHGKTGGTGITAPDLEMLIVGHLPVRAGLWLAPYAEARARTSGPTAMVRLEGSEPDLQLIGVCRDAPFQTDHLTLHEAIEQIGPSIALWIVRPPTSEIDAFPAATQIETPDSADLIPGDLTPGDLIPGDLIPGVGSRITILTGADEVAVVECYRIIKTIIEQPQPPDRETHSESLPELPALGVAMIGADEQTARDAFTRIQHTVAEHLGVEINLVLTLPHIGSDDPRDILGRDPVRWLSFSDQPVPSVSEVISWISRESFPPGFPEEHSPSIEVLPDPGIPIPVGAPPPMRLVSPPPEAEDQTAELPKPITIQEEIEGGSRVATAHPGSAPRQTICIETKQPSQIQEPNTDGHPVPLAEYVDGLTPLPVRPPHRERIELAVDKFGDMHLLCREADMRDLDVVVRWARDHHEILMLACPQLKNPTDAPSKMTRHVFTNTPVSLADLHGSDLHLHVLTKVTVEGKTGWYAAPLNLP